ncbi:hypothetical protein CTAYLR_005404 [Chrysophaeum taylorii]|uniref:BOP1 N-terminal domain-containing protein n=1 Tax=Chrysophaeum taylorii TaxID=2483200 RepID=A0AAD7U884_9STRA|nr:hypothetical protein CTAYLR_005404 [Chrysophaeum taylorii]
MDSSDDDDDDDEINKTGRVPLHWYDGYDHIGYDLDGAKVVAEAEDPLAEEDVVYDRLNGRHVRLTEEQKSMVRRIRAGSYAVPTTDYVVATHEKEVFPLWGGGYEPKRRFVPSKWEAAKISRLARGIKRGTIVQQRKKDPEEVFAAFADTLWQEDGPAAATTSLSRAPKPSSPGHEDSYRPPAEYDKRAHATLREVGAYDLVSERYARCQDLHLCPRGLKRRLNVDPETLVPKLPEEEDLKPYPNTFARSFCACVAVTISPDGQWVGTLVGGSARVFELATGRRIAELETSRGGGGEPTALAWNPHLDHHILAAAVGNAVDLLASPTARGEARKITKALLSSEDGKTEGWGPAGISTPHAIQTVAWHAKGDYLVTTSPSAPPSRQVLLHRASERQTQAPLKKRGGQAVQAASFHPTKPFLFVATKTHVRIYHLLEQALVKTLTSSCRWISSMDVHASGDHVVVGSCDRRLAWFDLDAGTTPYKTLKYHTKALRTAKFHPASPLLASCGDDAKVYVFHATVYHDLHRQPLIVPVHEFGSGGGGGGGGTLDLVFHPTQPWLLTTEGLFHHRDGFAVLNGVVPKGEVERFVRESVEPALRHQGISLEDPSGWPEGEGRAVNGADGSNHPITNDDKRWPALFESEKLRRVLDELHGGRWRWVDGAAEGVGWIHLRFPRASGAWSPPSRGWHLDGRACSVKTQQSVVLLPIVTALRGSAGGTALLRGSHVEIAAALRCSGALGAASYDRLRDFVDGYIKPAMLRRDPGAVVEARGEPGDLLLMHPLLYHSASSAHVGSPVRISFNLATHHVGEVLPSCCSHVYSPLEKSLLSGFDRAVLAGGGVVRYGEPFFLRFVAHGGLLAFPENKEEDTLARLSPRRALPDDHDLFDARACAFFFANLNRTKSAGNVVHFGDELILRRFYDPRALDVEDGLVRARSPPLLETHKLQLHGIAALALHRGDAFSLRAIRAAKVLHADPSEQNHPVVHAKWDHPTQPWQQLTLLSFLRPA